MQIRFGNQLAQRLGVSPPTLRRIARTDLDFPAVVRVSPHIAYVEEADVQRFLAAKRISLASVEARAVSPAVAAGGVSAA